MLEKKKKFERRFITALMKKGNYIKAEKLFYTLLNTLKTKGIKNPYFFVRRAFIKITPVMAVFTKKVGKREFFFPKYLDQRSADKYAIRWLLNQVGKQKSSQLITQVIDELKKALKNQGEIIAAKWKLYKEVRFAASKAPKVRKSNVKLSRNISTVNKKFKRCIRKRWL